MLEIEDLGRSEKQVAALAEGIARPAGGVVPGAGRVGRRHAAQDARAAARRVRGALRGACRRRAPSCWRGASARLAREGIEAEAGRRSRCVADACEGDPLAFFNELDKLFACAGASGRLTRDDGARCCGPWSAPICPSTWPPWRSATPGSRRSGSAGCSPRGVGEGAVLFALSNLVGGALGGWARQREPATHAPAQDPARSRRRTRLSRRGAGEGGRGRGRRAGAGRGRGRRELRRGGAALDGEALG